MNATSIDIVDILESESSLGLSFATNLFIGKEPGLPKKCVTISDTTSRSPLLNLDGNGEYYFTSVQIMVRWNDYKEAHDLINNIMLLLHGRHNETINNTLYMLISCAGSPTLLGYDEGNLVRFVLNVNCQRR